MKNLKTFNEMLKSNIHTGIKLTPKQINYISDGIDKEYLEHFEILLDDGVFYIRMRDEFWEFDRIQDLRDLIHLRHYISKNKPYEVLEIIKRNKNLDYNFDNNLPIRWASKNGHTEVVKILLQDDRVDPSVDNNYAIIWASSFGHTEVVKLLLQDKRVDPSDNDNSAIIFASENGHTEVVKLLLQDDRVDPSNWNNYAIIWSSEYGHPEIVKLLIKHPKVREKLTEKEIEKYEKY